MPQRGRAAQNETLRRGSSSASLNSRDTLGLFAFGSHDYLATRSQSRDPDARKELVEQFVSDFHRLDLHYDHALSEGRMRLALTAGYDRQGPARPVRTRREPSRTHECA